MSATVVAISNSHVFEGNWGAMPMKNGGERRGGRKGREKVFLRGTLEMPGRQPVECVVIDLSETGARIASAEAEGMHGRVRLSVPARNVLKDCLIVHRGTDDTIGVTFVPLERR